MQENKQLDLGGFTLYDSTAVEKGKTPQETQTNITNRLVSNIYYVFQAAVNAKKQQIADLQVLPQEQQIHDFQKSKYYLKLSEPSLLFPRSKRLPEEKILTKWQKFAKEKGINKHKRDAMKYDPTTKQSMARWGRKSKNNVELPIMEEKQYGKNPFQTVKNKKKLRIQKEKLKHIKNKTYREEKRNGH